MRELLTIKTDTQGLLRKQSKPVEEINSYILELIEDMKWYLEHPPLSSQKPVGLSAPQLGISLRISIVWQEVLHCILINPEVVKVKGSYKVAEGCLSIPRKLYLLERPKVVKVRYKDINGEQRSIKGHGLTAQILCHEVDHLNGLLVDRGKYLGES